MQRDQGHALGGSEGEPRGSPALPKPACDSSVAIQLQNKIESLSLLTRKQSVLVMTPIWYSLKRDK